MSNPRFVYTMTQAVTQDMPFIITTKVSESGRELYYDQAFASQEEAVLTCREIIKAAQSSGFIEIDITGHESHIGYIFHPYTGEVGFKIFNEYNAKMEEMYESEIRDNYDLPVSYHEELENWRNEDMPF